MTQKDIDQLVADLVKKHGDRRESLIPIMQGVVLETSYLSDKAMVSIAKALDLSTAEVYGTATFYSFIETKPRGKYVIRLCKSITCDMKGKDRMIKCLENLLKIKVGETTQDGYFTLLQTNCIGWCHKGPAMLINDKPYTELNSEKIREIVMEYMETSKKPVNV